jgi:hypothetical protein
MSSVLSSDSFAGVKEALTVAFSDLEEVKSDLEGEQESLPNVTVEDAQPIPEEEDDVRAYPGGIEELKKMIQNASKGVAEDTDKQYKK